ncbi:ECF RNA polymerase sigma factor SigW [subsurface metagenome]
MTDKRNKYVEVNKASGFPGPFTRDQNEVVKLVQKAIGGDSEAFGELYMTYVEPIYRYIFYQVRDKMTAEDITEDTFFKAWNSIHSCKGKEQTFSSWLYRIAHNSMIDVFRSRKKELFLDTETAAGIIDDTAKLETKLEHRQLMDAIALLPENQRQVIVLKFIEGLDNQEIEQVIRKSQGAIRILQMRALDTLRTNLGRLNG